MLKMAHYLLPWAMPQTVKALSRYHTDDNNHQGALNVIQAVLDGTRSLSINRPA